MAEKDTKDVQISCPACGKKIEQEQAYCPHCGVKVDQEAVEREIQKKKREAVSKQIDDIETTRVRPSLAYIIGGSVLAIAVILAVFTNAFGMYRTDSISPLAIYLDAAGNLLSLKSASFEYSLKYGEFSESGSGYFSAGSNFNNSALYIQSETPVGEVGAAVYNGKAAILSDGIWKEADISIEKETLSGIAMPFISERWALNWEQTFLKKSYNLDALTANIKIGIIGEIFNNIGLTLSAKGMEQLWEISERFIYKTLESRTDFDASFPEYQKTTADGKDTYVFTIDPAEMLNRYFVFINGAGKAPGYNQLRKDLTEYAGEQSEGSDSYDALDWIHQYLIPHARETGSINVAVTVGRRDRTVYEIHLRCDNLDFEYQLTVREQNSTVVDFGALEEILDGTVR